MISGSSFDRLKVVLDQADQSLRRGDLDEARRLFSSAFKIRWGHDGLLYAVTADGFVYPSYKDYPCGVGSVSKLRHDLDQMDYLIRSGKLGSGFKESLRSGLRVYRSLHPSERRSGLYFIRPERREALKSFLGKPFSIYSPNAVRGRALNRLPKPRELAKEIRSRGFAVVDDFLSPEALRRVQRFAVESAIWNDAKFKGYIASDLREGFCCGLLLQIGAELKSSLPAVLGRLPLIQIWGNKCENHCDGIPTHADIGIMSANFWITPDSNNLNPSGGGMLIYEAKAPASWSYSDYNADPDGIRKIVAKTGNRVSKIPYRCNRVVIFDSSRFHRTDSVRFKKGYENRRVNVTIHYGRRK